MYILELKKVQVKYQGVIWALRNVSLQVETAKVVALLGGNGAGKSTTLKAISGLLRVEGGTVTDGTIEFEGKRIENGDPAKIVRQGIIQVLEGRRILANLTVEENLRVGGLLVGTGAGSKRNLDMVYGYFPTLKDMRNRTSGYLSGGEQQMLVVGRALMGHPKLMLLDEASLGLAPLLVKEILRILRRINEEEKVSILLVEQNARAALSLASYGYVIENGSIAYSGSSDSLMQDPRVREFYLGFGKTAMADRRR